MNRILPMTCPVQPHWRFLHGHGIVSRNNQRQPGALTVYHAGGPDLNLNLDRRAGLNRQQPLVAVIGPRIGAQLGIELSMLRRKPSRDRLPGAGQNDCRIS